MGRKTKRKRTKAKPRQLKLSKIEKKVLRLIKGGKVKNIERPIFIGRTRGQAVDPHGKPLTATYVNLSLFESSQFRKLERRGLISVPRGKPEYFTNFKLTDKGKAQRL